MYSASLEKSMPGKKSKNPSRILEIHKRMHASDDSDELIRLEFEKMKARYDQNEENRKFSSGVRKGRPFFNKRRHIEQDQKGDDQSTSKEHSDEEV